MHRSNQFVENGKWIFLINDWTLNEFIRPFDVFLRYYERLLMMIIPTSILKFLCTLQPTINLFTVPWLLFQTSSSSSSSSFSSHQCCFSHFVSTGTCVHQVAHSYWSYANRRCFLFNLNQTHKIEWLLDKITIIKNVHQSGEHAE